MPTNKLQKISGFIENWFSNRKPQIN
jgi:hypothetical protein